MKSIFIFAATLSFMVYIVNGVIFSPERQGRRRRQSDCNFPCPRIFQPVCGSDGKTHVNACELRRADCLSPRKIILVHDGPCYCLLPKVVGPCEARIRRYYYNRRTRRCELFFYGGCRGNRNNFKTRAACEATCNRRRPY